MVFFFPHLIYTFPSRLTHSQKPWKYCWITKSTGLICLVVCVTESPMPCTTLRGTAIIPGDNTIEFSGMRLSVSKDRQIKDDWCLETLVPAQHTEQVGQELNAPCTNVAALCRVQMERHAEGIKRNGLCAIYRKMPDRFMRLEGCVKNCLWKKKEKTGLVISIIHFYTE